MVRLWAISKNDIQTMKIKKTMPKNVFFNQTKNHLKPLQLLNS